MAELYKEILTYIRKNSIDQSTIEEYTCIEYISSNIIDKIRSIANNYSLSNREYNTLTNSLYGTYSYCGSIQDVKFNILCDVIDSRLTGDKISYTEYKKKCIKESL